MTWARRVVSFKGISTKTTRVSSDTVRPRSGVTGPNRGNASSFVNESGTAPKREASPEAVETLVWLAESEGVDRRRYMIVNRLRAVRDSDQFATLPEDLRARVREIVEGG